MKKFIKLFFLITLILLVFFGTIFHKRILLAYRIIDNYVLSKESVFAYQEFNVNTALSSMNYRDVTYKSTNNVSLTLDIYGPTRQVYKSSPVLLYVHGGSFAYGDKSIPDAISPILDTFRDQGYTIISTSYELMKDKESFSKQISDVKDTIRWIHKNNSTYNLDTNEIGVIGISSGAYLSLMASYSGDNEFIDDPELSQYSSKIKYLIDFAGPTDLSLLNTQNLNYDLSKIFKSIENKDDLTKKYNPIDYVNPKIPNTLIIHSNSDAMVPYESSEELYEKCNQVNAKVKLITLNSSAHDLSTISNNDIASISKGLATFVIFNSPL